MPCNTIVLNSVKLEASDPKLRDKAAVALGWRRLYGATTEVRYQTTDGKRISLYADRIEVEAGQESLIDRFKVAYSREVVKLAARRFGWQVREQGPKQFEVSRRF